MVILNALCGPLLLMVFVGVIVVTFVIVFSIVQISARNRGSRAANDWLTRLARVTYKLMPKNYLELYRQGHRRFNERDFDGALKLFTEVMERKPFKEHGYMGVAFILQFQLKFEEALEIADEGLFRIPESYSLYQFRANSLFLLQDDVSCHNAINVIFKLTQGEIDRIGEKQSRYRKKLKRLMNAQSNAHSLRGSVYRLQGKLDEALREYDIALSLNSESSGIHHNRGLVWIELGEWEKALSDFDSCFGLNNQSESVLLARAYVYEVLDQYDKAISDYTSYIEQAHDLLHNSINTDDYDWMISNSLTKVAKDVPSAHSNRGEAYFILGQYDDALTDFEKALELKDDLSIAQAGKAVALHQLGRNDEAVALWKTLIDEDENYNDVAWVKDKLNWAQALVDEAEQIIMAIGVQDGN